MTQQEIQRANEVLSADPGVQAALAAFKQGPVDRFGAQRLQGAVLQAGAKALKGAGIQLDNQQRIGGGSGELEYRDWMTRNWSSKVLPAIAVGIAAAPFAAAAIGGAGAAGGAGGGAAGAAGGTAGSLSPLASGALPGATGSGLFGGAAAGGGGAAGVGGAAASVSPVGASLASGALPAATGSSLFSGGAAAGGVGGGGSLFSKLLDAAGSDGVSNVVGGIATGRAAGENADNKALTDAMNSRILAEQQTRRNASEDTTLAKRADIINNIQDVSATHPRANIVHFQGGLRPSLFGAGTKEAATLAGGQALDRLRQPSDLLNPANFPDPNKGSVVDKALEVAGPATAIANLIRRRRGGQV